MDATHCSLALACRATHPPSRHASHCSCSWDPALGKLWADQPCRQDLSYSGPCTMAGQQEGFCSNGICKVSAVSLFPRNVDTDLLALCDGEGE